MVSTQVFVLADVGGTHTRCAIARAGDPPTAVRTYRNRDFDGLAALLETYLATIGEELRPQRALLAIAAPVLGPSVRMTNLDWTVDSSELRGRLGLRDVRLINDFAAQAWALPVLASGETLAIGPGRARDGFPMVVLGPGTGLGVAALLPLPAGGHVAVSTEGGHVTMPATDPLEERVIARARAEFGHCSAERLLSGPGLVFLHRALHEEAVADAGEIGARAERDEPRAVETIERFFAMLGTVAGNLALSYGALGGVWIGGGIIPRYAQRFIRSGFRQRFEDKGRKRTYAAAIPTRLIMTDQPALRGLAALAAQPEAGMVVEPR